MTRRNATETRVPARRDAAKYRAGSVLILVVALLVLMALLGTAYISTTRIDRQTSAQHTKNVQIDMLVQGVVNQVSQAIQGDLYDASGNYRPPDTTTFRDYVTNPGESNNYDNYDGFGFRTPFDITAGQIAGKSPNVPLDAFLAKRMPWSQSVPIPAGAGAMGSAWMGVSYPLDQVVPTGTLVGNLWEFNSPDSTTAFPLSLPFRPTYGGTNGQTYTAKPWFVPTYKAINGVNYPALIPIWLDPTTGARNAPQASAFVAADVDGDGIADSGLYKLPIGPIDGVTYYVATRIIDNNSALNVNAALSNVEYTGVGTGTTAGQWSNASAPAAFSSRYYTPASEGLAQLLRTTVPAAGGPEKALASQGLEIQGLVQAWIDQTTGSTVPPPGVQGSTAPLNTPYYDDGMFPASTGPLYQYQSVQDALTQLLGVRSGNPGTVAINGAATVQAQPFSVTDSMALAYHFGLLNPQASESPLESLFDQAGQNNNPKTKDSIYQDAPNFGSKLASYPPDQIAAWYNGSFNFEGETPGTPSTFLPRRTMLVTSNPVSWQAPVHQIPKNQIPAPPNDHQRLDPYVLASGMPDYLWSTANANTIISEAKTSINQAPFGELWRAFWNVMAEKVTVPPGSPSAGAVYDGSPEDLRMLWAARVGGAYMRGSVAGSATFVDSPTFNDPYLGTQFGDYVAVLPAVPFEPYQDATNPYDPTVDMTAANRPTDYHPARMFRSPIRAIPDPGPPMGTSSTPGFDASTPRLNADQVTLLRSALAAVNAEDLRDSDDDVTAHRIILHPTNGAFNRPNGGEAPAEAIVYGTERQPYITEVYAETDTANPGEGTPNAHGYVAVELYNPYDTDISLKNWKIVAIDRRSGDASLTTMNAPPYRNTSIAHNGGTAVTSKYNIPLDNTTLIAELDPDMDFGGATPVDPADATHDVVLEGGTAGLPWGTGMALIVPAKGYLLLENYDPSGGGPLAGPGHRPKSTGLPGTGDLAGAGFNRGTDPSTVTNLRAPLPRVNVACIPGLSGMPDTAWQTTEWPVGVRSVFNREMIFLKPRRADGQYSKGIYPQIVLPSGAIVRAKPFDETPNSLLAGPDAYGRIRPLYASLRDMVPVDSFDFTGLQLPMGTEAEPLDKGSASPTSGEAMAWHYVRQNVDAAGQPDWKFVYPGRYQAYLTTDPNALTQDRDPRARQQGTQYARDWLNGPGTNPWDLDIRVMSPPPSFGVDPTNNTTRQSNANPVSSYPTSVFQIPLALGNVSPDPTYANIRNTIGESPLSAGPNQENHYPFGGFAREGDILATPFIGAYTIRYLTILDATGFTPAMQDYGSNYTVAEINPVTMDSVFAEDTDIYDDPDATTDATANGTLEREHIGRFIPLKVLLNRKTPALTTPPDAADYAATGYPKPNFTNYLAGSNKGIAVNDFGYDPSYVPGSTGKANWEPFWRYHWADDLFDYLSVRTPSDDYLPNIPMQKEWHPVDPNIATPTLQYQYRIGDLVSYYNPNSVISPGVTVPAHEIWRCTGNVQPSASKLPAQAGFTRIFQCRAVKNSLDQIKFSDATFSDAHADSAAFRTDPNEVASAQQAYADAHREDNATVEGLININTADWKVLSTLPLVVNPLTGLPDDTLVSSITTLPGFPAGAYPGYTFRQLNQEMAKAIEYYRDVNANPDVVRTPGAPLRPHGPFRSIEELNQVVDLRPGRSPALNPSPTSFGYPINTLPGFRNGLFTVALPMTRTDEPGDTLGDFSPADINGVVNPDGVRGDYEERNLQLTRISNMITTRSDSFTCYILVQGWRNAETPQAQLVVQRRVGYLMDRSRVTPLTPDAMSIEPFPNN